MHRPTIITILLLALILVLAAPLLAQISARYDLTWPILSGGGGPRSSPNFYIDDALGQWPDGRSTSPNYQLDPGFFHAGRVLKNQSLYLPAVFNVQ
jgi:hypothetical protein